MRLSQRALGIMAGAFLFAGAALAAGTAVYAHFAAPSAPSAGLPGPLHREHGLRPGGGPFQPPGRPNV